MNKKEPDEPELTLLVYKRLAQRFILFAKKPIKKF